MKGRGKKSIREKKGGSERYLRGKKSKERGNGSKGEGEREEEKEKGRGKERKGRTERMGKGVGNQVVKEKKSGRLGGERKSRWCQLYTALTFFYLSSLQAS